MSFFYENNIFICNDIKRLCLKYASIKIKSFFDEDNIFIYKDIRQLCFKYASINIGEKNVEWWKMDDYYSKNINELEILAKAISFIRIHNRQAVLKYSE